MAVARIVVDLESFCIVAREQCMLQKHFKPCRPDASSTFTRHAVLEFVGSLPVVPLMSNCVELEEATQHPNKLLYVNVQKCIQDPSRVSYSHLHY